MRMFPITVLAALPLMAVTSGAQDNGDPYSIAAVRFELQMRVGELRMRHSFSQKQLARLGDGVSVALIKILDQQEILDPKTLPVVMAMIREAFSNPSLISIEENKKPQITLMLLDQLRSKLRDQQMNAEIDETVSFVKGHTT